MASLQDPKRNLRKSKVVKADQPTEEQANNFLDDEEKQLFDMSVQASPAS